MNRSETVQFDYQEQQVVFHLLEDCSVSRHIGEQLVFYEQDLLENLATLLPRDAVVVDVGAHIGNHTIFFSRILGLDVVSFEPNPEAYELLQKNIAANGVSDRVVAHQLALSDQRHSLRMARSSESDVGSMSVVRADRAADIEIQAATLDDFVEEVGDRPVYLKLDVEGHELKVIRGGSRFIERHRPLISVEILALPAYDDILTALGDAYTPIGLFNPTPTVVLAVNGETRADLRVSMARYGVAKALNYNQRRDWYVAQRDRVEKLLARTEDLSARNAQLAERSTELAERSRQLAELRVELLQVIATERKIVDGLVSILGSRLDRSANLRYEGRTRSVGYLRRTARETSLPRPFRIAVFSFGEASPDGALLSLYYETADVVTVRKLDGQYSLSLQRFSGGHCIERWSSTLAETTPLLVAAEVRLLLDEGPSSERTPDLSLFIAPEALYDLAAPLIDTTAGPYLVMAEDPTYSYPRLRPLMGAAAAFVASDEARATWQQGNLVPASVLNVHDLEQLTKEIDLLVAPEPTPEPLLPSEPSPGQGIRLLLVSYFAFPATPVSVQRLRYWHDQLSELARERDVPLEVWWLSATGQAAGLARTMVVRDRGHLYLPDDYRQLYDRLGTLRLDRLGVSWTHYVEQAVSRMQFSFDVVVLSGNPFYYFSLASLFKDLWKAKVILDFRDPFARNPRFRYSVDQRTELISYEDRVVAEADAVVSVNDECLASIAPHMDARRFVISNGFDERVVDSIVPADLGAEGFTKIAYSGTVFANLPLDTLLDALPPASFRLYHFGRDYSASKAANDHPVSETYGMMDYAEMIGRLKACDAGVVMTTGEASTQTTKLFDYIACGLDIIIVTEGEPRTGNLHAMTHDLEGVFWVRNDPAELSAFFSTYTPTHPRRRRRADFSRRHQTNKLLDVLTELEGA